MKLYKFTGTGRKTDSLPPQAAAIVEEIESKGVVRRDELLASLDGRFKNYVQSPEHVLAFYRSRLIREGFLIEFVV